MEIPRAVFRMAVVKMVDGTWKDIVEINVGKTNISSRDLLVEEDTKADNK